MMFEILEKFDVGAPQIAALLILAQRGIEELYSMRNTKKLLQQGAIEVGQKFYPVVAATHLGWIAALFLLIPSNAAVIWSLVWLYVLVQFIRYWVIGILGQYWTHRIITLVGAPIVASGPYKYVRHPNYIVTMLETALLPLCFNAYAIAIIMTGIWGAVIQYKIHLEDGALITRRSGT